MLFRRDPFGHYFIGKWLVVFIMGVITYLFLRFVNRLHIHNHTVLKNLDETGVLFISNHQTYFADVIAMYHTFNSIRWGVRSKITSPFYLAAPRLNNYYIAAEETMKLGIIPKLLSYVGAVSVRRTWRDKEKSVKRSMRFADMTNIGTALGDGWVITFPQGTTQPHAPGRRGIVSVIKKYNPVIIPVVVDGFREAFKKKSIFPRKSGVNLSLRLKEPLQIDQSEAPDIILARIMAAIEEGPEVD